MLRTGTAAAVILCAIAPISAQVVDPLLADEHTLLLYHFDAEGPEIIDSGPLGLHGTVVEGEGEERTTLEQVPRVDGVCGQALSLGEGQALVPATTPDALRGMDQLTVEAGFMTTNEDPQHRQRIVLYWEHYLISIFEGGRMVGNLYDQDGENHVLRGTGVIDPGRWYHTALTWDGDRARLWLNGREVASLRMSGTINPAPGSGLQFGAVGGDWFEGAIDEIRISSIARESFPAARQYDFCRPAETLLVSPGTARMVFDPVVPPGVTEVTCTASLGGVGESAVVITGDTLKPDTDGLQLGHAEVMLDLPEGHAMDTTFAGQVSYEREASRSWPGWTFPSR